jgi:hypothetical protein
MSRSWRQVNNFKEQLCFSNSEKARAFFRAVYKKRYVPEGLRGIKYCDDMKNQLSGVDVRLYFTDFQIRIDEKLRTRRWHDILVEYVSNDKTGAPGWAEKKQKTHILAYGFYKSRECYLISFKFLSRFWVENKEAMLSQYGTKKAPNAGYSTLNCPVPITVLNEKITVNYIKV